jgi:hypothetical protein
VEPKVVQTILRHSRIQTTLDIHTQGDADETRAAQGVCLKELGMASEMRPTNGPTSNRVGAQFSFDQVRILAGGTLASSVRLCVAGGLTRDL